MCLPQNYAHCQIRALPSLHVYVTQAPQKPHNGPCACVWRRSPKIRPWIGVAQKRYVFGSCNAAVAAFVGWIEKGLQARCSQPLKVIVSTPMASLPGCRCERRRSGRRRRFRVQSLRKQRLLICPVQCHYFQISSIDLAVAVDVSCDNRLTDWLTKVCLACFRCTTVGTHIDETAIREGF